MICVFLEQKELLSQTICTCVSSLSQGGKRVQLAVLYLFVSKRYSTLFELVQLATCLLA